MFLYLLGLMTSCHKTVFLTSCRHWVCQFYGWDIITSPKREAYLFSGLFIEFLHLLNITCFFQWVTVWETRKASTSQELVFTYKVLLFLNFLCYPLIKILAVILWQMFRDVSGQFLPTYQGEYTKQALSESSNRPQVILSVVLLDCILNFMSLFTPAFWGIICFLYAYWLLCKLNLTWQGDCMHLFPSFLFYFSNFVQVYLESQRLDVNCTIMSCCVTKVSLHQDFVLYNLIQGILILSAPS